jgi:hypothetical protein
MSWLEKLWFEQAKNYVYSKLLPEQVTKQQQIDNISIHPDSLYVSIFLISFSIPYLRRGSGKYFGAVHSFISIPHKSGQNAQFNMFISPDNLKEIDSSRVDRILVGKHRLLGPIPYRGGDIKLELGLFSIKSSDLAGPFLKILQNMASVAGVNSVNVAIPFVKPILDGINDLAEAGHAVLEIGQIDTLNKPTTGYFIIIQAQEGTINISKIRLEQDAKLYDSNGLVKFPYLVYSVEVSDRRADWFSLPELVSAYEKIVQATRYGDISRAEEAFKSFKMVTLTSHDLLIEDAEKLVSKVEEELKRIFPAQTTSINPKPILKNLSDIDLYSN